MAQDYNTQLLLASIQLTLLLGNKQDEEEMYQDLAKRQEMK